MNSLRTSLTLVAALVVGLLAWTGCDSSGSDAGGATGSMTLSLTDAPADSATAVNVTIERIALVPGEVDDDDSDGDSDSDSDADDGDDSDQDGFVDIYNPDSTQTINLLDYQDSSVELANGADVPEGEYNQMRLFLSDAQKANTIEFDGNTEPYELKTPSAPQSGYKVNIPGFTVDEDSDRISLTLDFDASKSVVKAGGSGMYILKPVVRPEDVTFSDGSLELPDVKSTGEIESYTDTTLTVEGVQFDVTSETEFEDVNSFGDLSSFSYAGVEGVEADDGTYDATYIEAIENEDKRFALQGPLTAQQDTVLTFFSNTKVSLTPNSAPDEDVPGTLTTGSTYDVEFTKDSSGNRFATEIEAEN